MTDSGYNLSLWTPEQTAVLEAWGYDRREALQAGLDAALTLMFGADTQLATDDGPVVPLRGEGDTIAALYTDLLDDLLAQIALYGPMQEGVLDGVLKRDRGGFVAWGYLHPQVDSVSAATFELETSANSVLETPEEIRLRITLRRLA